MTENAKDNLYLLQDGTHVSSNDVAKDKHGVLRHKNGLAVATREDGKPYTIGEAAIDNKNVEAANAGRPSTDNLANADAYASRNMREDTQHPHAVAPLMTTDLMSRAPDTKAPDPKAPEVKAPEAPKTN